MMLLDLPAWRHHTKRPNCPSFILCIFLMNHHYPLHCASLHTNPSRHSLLLPHLPSDSLLFFPPRVATHLHMLFQASLTPFLVAYISRWGEPLVARSREVRSMQRPKLTSMETGFHLSRVLQVPNDVSNCDMWVYFLWV